MVRENLAYVIKMCQIAPFLIFSKEHAPEHTANVQLYYHSLYKLNSVKQSNTSELTKLHHLSNFLVGRCPEFPYQARSCKIIISLSIFI